MYIAIFISIVWHWVIKIQYISLTYRSNSKSLSRRRNENFTYYLNNHINLEYKHGNKNHLWRQTRSKLTAKFKWFKSKKKCKYTMKCLTAVYSVIVYIVQVLIRPDMRQKSFSGPVIIYCLLPFLCFSSFIT